MSVYFHVYAGPVLVCKYHMQDVSQSKTVTYRGCPNQGCKYNNPKHSLGQTANFCPKCGTALQAGLERVKNSTKTVKSVGHIFETLAEGGFREDLLDEAWGGTNNEKLIEDTDVFELSTDKFDADVLGRKTRFEARDFNIHLHNPDIKAEIAKAEEFFAKEIAYLRTKYDAVTVEWMVLTNGR